MSDIAFVLDASALSRKFYDDIGKSNLEKIFSRSDDSFFVPEIGIIETISALLSSVNSQAISLDEYGAAKSALYNMIENNEIYVISPENGFYWNECISILEEYKLEPEKSFNGADSIYINSSRKVAETLAPEGIRVIFVTSDNKLYNACKEEDSFDTFHFWTCNFGCGHANVIPVKGAKDTPAKQVKCNNCNSMFEVKPEKISPNTCQECGSHCHECNINICPSTYEIDIDVWG